MKKLNLKGADEGWEVKNFVEWLPFGKNFGGNSLDISTLKDFGDRLEITIRDVDKPGVFYLFNFKENYTYRVTDIDNFHPKANDFPLDQTYILKNSPFLTWYKGISGGYDEFRELTPLHYIIKTYGPIFEVISTAKPICKNI